MAKYERFPTKDICSAIELWGHRAQVRLINYPASSSPDDDQIVYAADLAVERLRELEKALTMYKERQERLVDMLDTAASLDAIRQIVGGWVYTDQKAMYERE